MVPKVAHACQHLTHAPAAIPQTRHATRSFRATQAASRGLSARNFRSLSDGKTGELPHMRISDQLRNLFCLTTLTLACAAAPPATKRKMKAVIIHQYGGPEVLKLEDVTRPEP